MKGSRFASMGQVACQMARRIRVNDLVSADYPKKFWGMVFLMAVRDNATSVHYHPWRGDGALAYIVDDVRFEMHPPPVEWAGHLVKTARYLAVRPQSIVTRILSGRGDPTCGKLTLCVDEHEIEWQVVCWWSGARIGVEFIRISPPVDAVADVPVAERGATLRKKQIHQHTNAPLPES